MNLNLLKKTIIFFALPLLMGSCSLFKKSTSNSRIEPKGSYIIVSQTKLSQNKEFIGEIEGYVFDDYSKTPISYGYVVSVDKESYKTTIDSVGYFQISLPPNTYKLKITSVGNKELTTDTIRVREGFTTRLDVYLGSDIMFEKE